MADEVNTAAFNGGDTEAGTKAAIQARNEALQTIVDDLREDADYVPEAREARHVDTPVIEQNARDDAPRILTGDPINTRPAELEEEE